MTWSAEIAPVCRPDRRPTKISTSQCVRRLEHHCPRLTRASRQYSTSSLSCPLTSRDCADGADGDDYDGSAMTRKQKTIFWSLLAVLLLALAIGVALLIAKAVSDARQAATEAPPSPEARPAAQGQPQESRRPPMGFAQGGYGGERYYGGKPEPTRQFPYALKVLDNIAYSVGYCPQRKTPAWVAYRVQKARSYQAPPRPKGFLPDPRIPDGPRSDDYSRSGYDRGHMAPNYVIAICYGTDAQRETFLMTNIVPQRPQLNRQVWEELESTEAKYPNQCAAARSPASFLRRWTKWSARRRWTSCATCLTRWRTGWRRGRRRGCGEPPHGQAVRRTRCRRSASS